MNESIKYTNNISNIFFYENEYTVDIYKYLKQNILTKILCDDYQLLTFSEIINIIDGQIDINKIKNKLTKEVESIDISDGKLNALGMKMLVLEAALPVKFSETIEIGWVESKSS